MKMIEKDRDVIIYLSGPISGIIDYRGKFDVARKDLKNKFECQVIDPTDKFDGYSGFTRDVYMSIDFSMVRNSDAVVVLPGWGKSQGAVAEVIFADQINIPVYYIGDLESPIDLTSVSVERITNDRTIESKADFTYDGRDTNDS